jgi:hypothetical protein
MGAASKAGRSRLFECETRSLASLVESPTDKKPFCFIERPKPGGCGIPPKIPGGLQVNPFDEAYAALGSGGQMIVVLPNRDLVIAHKVEIEGPNASDMPILEQATLVQLVITARCSGPCK